VCVKPPTPNNINAIVHAYSIYRLNNSEKHSRTNYEVGLQSVKCKGTILKKVFCM